MKTTEFDKSWNDWVDHNVARQCDKKEIFQILLDNNFDYNLIKNKLKIDYTEKKPSLHKNPKRKCSIPSNAKKVDTDLVEIFTIDNFLSKEQCEHLISLSKKYLQASKITTQETEPDKKFRTSLTAHLNNLKSNSEKKFMDSINQLICDTINIPNEFSESIQVQNYQVGKEFKIHTDYFTPHTREYNMHCQTQGNRTWTFMVYLDTVEEGGATFMSKLDKRFYPKQGMALFWNNLNKDGSVNTFTFHAGEPPLKGEKNIITKWFREYSN